MILPLLIVAAPALPQVPSRKELAEAVGKAHRAEAAAEVTSFKTSIQVLIKDPTNKFTGDIDQLNIVYAKSVELGKHKFAMGRFTFREKNAEQTLALGPGPKGRMTRWIHKNGKSRRLTERTDEQTRKNLSGYMSLCEQMLAFIDPGAVLTRLKGEDPVVLEKGKKFFLGKKWQVRDAYMIHGVLDAFPRFDRDGGDTSQRVRLKFWIDKESSYLLQLQITPLGATGLSKGGRSEMVRFIAWDDKLGDGRRMPARLYIYQLKDDRPMRDKGSITVSFNQKFALNPELSKDDFSAPK